MILLNKIFISETTARAAEAEQFGLWPVYANPMRTRASVDYSSEVIVETFSDPADAAAFAAKLTKTKAKHAYALAGGKLKCLGSIDAIEAAAAAAEKSETRLFQE